MTQYERRFLQSDLEVRRVGETAKITGYAAVFNKDADIMGMFTERVAPGAFKKTIKDGDIRALQNHDPNFVLGRTKSGTLKLAEDTRGLHYNIDANLRKTTVRDLVEDIERGDISQSSFGFLAVHDEWDYQTEPPKRTLLENRLFDVSPVTFPAYEDTDAQIERALRSLATETHPLPDLVDALQRGELRSYLGSQPARAHLTVVQEIDEHRPSDLDERIRRFGGR